MATLRHGTRGCTAALCSFSIGRPLSGTRLQFSTGFISGFRPPSFFAEDWRQLERETSGKPVETALLLLYLLQSMTKLACEGVQPERPAHPKTLQPHINHSSRAEGRLMKAHIGQFLSHAPDPGGLLQPCRESLLR